MKTYCCYFIDRTLHSVRHESVQCADDQTALEVARKLLGQCSHAGIEVWDQERYVAHLLHDSNLHERWNVGPDQDLSA
jgi:uncharacterized protein YqjF (DUF2071 family)